MSEEKKTFMQVKPGDTVYKVCPYCGKTRIIKKKVKSVKNKNAATLTIHCEGKDSEYYTNMFPKVLSNASLHLDVYSTNTYLCTNIEDAKIACNKLANAIVSRTDKNISELLQKLNKWRLHQEELHNGNYIIK